MLKQQLQQKLQQKLSPQQIQIIRLLELNSLEFEERVKQEIIENPALEEGAAEPSADNTDDLSAESPVEERTDTESAEQMLLGDYASEDDIPSYRLEADRGPAVQREEIPFAEGSSFHEFLLSQLGLRDLDERQQQIAAYIIGNIDDDGYLRRPLSAISDDLIFQTGVDASVNELGDILRIIQDFDPAGVSATSLQECLLLQLRRKTDSPANRLAQQILTDAFEAFSKKHYDKIERQFDITSDQLKAAIDAIVQLNPKPGTGWSDNRAEMHQQVVPDFIIETENDEIFLSLNNANLPQLRVSRQYGEMAHDYAANSANQTRERKEALLFVKQKLDAANWFIEAIKQRQQTMLSAMQVMIDLQRDFFITGDEKQLKPMILKDVAERTHYDISTISRTTNGKYMQVNGTVYPVKYLFSEGIQNEKGESVSTREIKRLLQSCIEEEEKSHPLSDDKLCEILQEKGYPIARRTVAKYREQLGIPVARLRKEL